MVLREPFNMRKISSNRTKRRYARSYTGLPVRLISTGMVQKSFLGGLGERISDVLGANRSRKKRAFVN